MGTARQRRLEAEAWGSMKSLVFSIVWTVIATVFMIAFHFEPEFQQEGWLFQWAFRLMPALGLLVIWDSWRKLRRFRSVRSVRTKDGETFTWTELNGSEQSSPTDPRPKWIEDDRLSDP